MTPYEAFVRAQLIRLGRTAKVLIAAARRHLPKWLAALLTVALLIPGPQDELVVLLILGVWAAFKPEMRKDIAATVSAAWNIYEEETA